MKESHETVAGGHRRFLLFAILLAGILGAASNAHGYYHPTLGRFVQRDRERYVDGMNLYEYVGSRPVSFADWTGMDYEPFVGTVEGARKEASRRLAATRPSEKPLIGLSGATDTVKEHARSYLKKPRESRRFVSWQAKRGVIHFAMVLRKKMAIALPGALMTMDFVPDKDVGDCCDTIEILQFVHGLKDGEDFFTDPAQENRRRSYKGWYVDRITDKPGKSPYMARQARGSNPGRAGKNAKPLIFHDGPWLNEQVGNPSQLGQAFVTCVVCIEGVDAKRAGGVDIYGCVAWGWFWRRRTPSRGEVFNVMGPRFTETLPEPRVTFEEVIKRWNANSGPRHRINYKRRR